MTYLITGATGFLGTKLVHQLLSAGHSVNYLGRRRSSTLDSRAAFHRWDKNEDPPLDSVPDLDAIIHLAGEPISQRWTPEVKQRIRDSRVEGTRRLVDAIGRIDRRPPVLVCASAVGYYGDRGAETLTEQSPPGTGFLPDVCVAWEYQARRAEEFGLRVVSVRIGIVLGKEGGALPKMLTPFKLGLGGVFGNGQQWMPWIHVDDLLNLFIFAAETKTATGALNGTSPHPVTNREFTRELAHALHRPAILPVPRFALKVMLGEMSDLLFASTRAVPERTVNREFVFRYPELGPALRSLLQP